MFNKRNISYFIGTLLLFIAIATAIFIATQKSNNTVHTNLNTSTGLALNALCNCIALSFDYTGSYAVNSVTGKSVELALMPSSAREDGYEIPYLSRSETAMAAFINKGKTLAYQQADHDGFQTLYTAPGDAALAWLTWSTDEKDIVVGLQVPADAQPTEGTWPTTILSIHIADGKVTTITTRDQVKRLGLSSITPMAVSADAKTILFVSGELGSEKYFVWSKIHPQLKQVSTNIAGTIYLASDAVNGGEVLWYLDGLLHRLNIDTLKESMQPLDAISDGPISSISPDGKKVVYLKRLDQTQSGQLTLLDLSNGQEHQLSTTAISASSGLGRTAWVPDSSYFIFEDQPSPAPSYFAIRTDTSSPQNPVRLQDIPSLHDQPITGFWPIQNIPDVNLSLVQEIDAQIENWPLYQPGKSSIVTYTDSPGRDPKLDRFLHQVANGDQFIQYLNGGLSVVMTPNYPHWTQAQLTAAFSTPHAWGGVGVPEAFWVSQDKILWMMSCIGGIGPDPEGLTYPITARCYQAEQIVRRHFACHNAGSTCSNTSGSYTYSSPDSPLSVSVPALWQAEFQSPYEGNSLTHSAEPFSAINLRPFQQTPDSVGTLVQIAWYDQKQDKPLSVIDPIFYGKRVSSAEMVLFGRPALHIVTTQNPAAQGIAGEDIYLLRLNNSQVLEVYISYQSSNQKAKTAKDVQFILDSVKLKG